jgi:hypothetical protein
LDEALGLADGARGVRAGEDLFDAPFEQEGGNGL